MKPVIIIGGGVIGLCTAYSLQQRDIPVTVLDAGPADQAASHVNAGWIVPAMAEPVPAPGLIATSLRWMLRSDSPLFIDPRALRDPAFLRWTLDYDDGEIVELYGVFSKDGSEMVSDRWNAGSVETRFVRTGR